MPRNRLRDWIRATEHAAPEEQWTLLCFLAGRSVDARRGRAARGAPACRAAARGRRRPAPPARALRPGRHGAGRGSRRPAARGPSSPPASRRSRPRSRASAAPPRPCASSAGTAISPGSATPCHSSPSISPTRSDGGGRSAGDGGGAHDLEVAADRAHPKLARPGAVESAGGASSRPSSELIVPLTELASM